MRVVTWGWCNDRAAACIALDGIGTLALPNQQRLERMRGKIPNIEVGTTLVLDENWNNVRKAIERV